MDTDPDTDQEEQSGPVLDATLRHRSESAREKITLRYLREWTNEFKPKSLDRPAFPLKPEDSIPAPSGCGDVSLTAFAQLSALRFGARRCLVSLITSNVEYVLAEATRTMSLQYDTAQDSLDGPFIGTCSFRCSEGLNGDSMPAWRKARRLREIPEDEQYYYREGEDPHFRIVSDTRQIASIKDRPLIVRGSKHRFYFSVPLRDQKGTAIGALTLMDDKPRFGVSQADMSLAEDLADTIVRHLDSVVTRSQRQRSERLIQGLGLFNNDKDSLREWWLGQEDERLRKGGRRRDDQSVSMTDRKSRADEEFGNQSSSSRRGGSKPPSPSQHASTAQDNASARLSLSRRHIESRDFDKRPESTSEQRHVSEASATFRNDQILAVNPRRKSKVVNGFSLAQESERTYARASNLLREGLSVEGVVFVDATTARHGRSSISSEGSNSGSSASRGSSPSAGGLPGESEKEPSDTDASYPDSGGSSARICKVNGFSTRIKSSINRSSEDFSLKLPNKLMSRLLKSYPHGKVWNFNERGMPYGSTSGDDIGSTSSASGSGKVRKPRSRSTRDAEQLARLFSGARAIAIYPIFDETSERWRSCSIVWSTTQNRLFDESEDILYLAAFGHSITSKLSALESMAADLSKGAFIGSISHELRSPLHGILAGVEFLQDSDLTTFQNEMVTTVNMAGRTLLDTVNNILDYSKISNFTQAQRAERIESDNARHKTRTSDGHAGEVGVSSNIDLSRLTEEVLESVVSAHRYAGLSKNTSAPIYDEGPAPSTKSGGSRSSITSRDGKVSVILRIDHADSWLATISAGSWTRLITNLVGNALKYTKVGSVSVRLERMNADALSQGKARESKVRLTVEDTGIGMSKAFLANDLYTPFKQEDSHASGTGLGLSIVKQICKDMNIALAFDSQLGKGTRARLEFTPTMAPKSVENADHDLLQDLELQNMCLLHRSIPTVGDPAAISNQMLVDSVVNMSSQWFNLRASTSSDLAHLNKNTVLAITEHELSAWRSSAYEELNDALYTLGEKGNYLLVLASSFQATRSWLDLPMRATHVQQPIGPGKLSRIIRAAETTTAMYISSSGHATDTSPPPTMMESPKGTIAPASNMGSFFPEQPWKVSSENVKQGKSVSIGGSSGRTVPVTESAEKKQESHAKVLLVEDNEINMKLLVALIRKLKLEYTCAINGLEAVQKYSKTPNDFFLTLMDMSMPVLDGCSATAKIREFERRNRLARCPVYALTGVTSATARDEALSAGVDRFMTKPISMRELQALVRELKGDQT